MTKIILIICLLSLIPFSLASGYKHGESCSYDSQCEGQMICPSRTYRCSCKAGYGYIDQSGCTPFDSFQCTSDSQCQDYDKYRVCNQSKCLCKDKYQELSDKLCTRIQVGHLESCDKNEDCKGELYCYPRTNKCICKQGYLWSRTSDDCRSFDSYQCAQDIDCQDRDPNRICSQQSDKCVCRDGYQATYSTSTCTKAKNSYNESCNEDKECAGELNCYDVGFGNKKCQCEAGYFWRDSSKDCYGMGSYTCDKDVQCQDRDKNRLCLQNYCKCRPDYMVNYKNLCEKKYSYREPCKVTSSIYSTCQSNLTCSNELCLCTSGYIWSDKEHRCKPFQDGSCTTDLQCQDQDNQRTCDLKKGKCVCKQGMFENDEKKCRKQIALGGACNNTNECATTNSMCHKATCNAQIGLCVCKPTHRRSGTFCVTHTCTQSSDCYSSIFDEDNHMICDGNKQCNCQAEYTVDLVEGRCRYSGSDEGHGHKPNFANSIKFNFLSTLFIVLLSIIKLTY